MDRGRFVKLAGAGAGAAFAGSLVTAGTASAAESISLDVAVIVPSGSRYANMDDNLLAGLKHGFDRAHIRRGAVEATIVHRSIAGGYLNAVATAEALLEDGPDVVVACVSAPVAARLAPLFEARKKPLIVANVGAHLVLPSARSPYVLHNSLMYWQACFLSGQYAGRGGGLNRKAFVATAQADAGYDTVYAFRRGFEAAGGTIVGEGVTHADPASSGIAALFDQVRESGADLVFGLYSGAHAVEFMQASAGSGAQILVGSLAVEDYLLPRIGGAAVGTVSSSSWTLTRKTKANQAFTSSFASRFGRAADPFAALGYDTAALIVEGVHRASRGLGVRRLVEALGGASIDSPRGRLTVDAATNTVTARLAVRSVGRSARGPVNVDLGMAQPIPTFPDALAALATDPRSGYINEYLCA
jgi:branched-chain amino acid transport system substrate-binding protein